MALFEQKAEPSHKRKVAVATAVAVAVAAALIAVAAGSCAAKDDGEHVEAPKPTLAQEKAEGAEKKVGIEVQAEGADLSADPLVVRITGTTDGNRSYEAYHAVWSEKDSVKLVPGAYTLTAVPLALEDGRVLGLAEEPVTVSVDAKGGADGIALALSEKGKEGAAEKIASEMSRAAERGDSSLDADAAAELAEKAASRLAG